MMDEYRRRIMIGWLSLAGGVLLVGMGALWTLQGLGVVGGSVMSGATQWAVIGPIVAVLGIWLVVRGVRRVRAGNRRREGGSSR
ncbi:hypothetical protein EJK15_38080 [Nonomuraea basaltis]|nr:hypothetical protein EJK15_38080 [Nonomuraea basaltis]